MIIIDQIKSWIFNVTMKKGIRSAIGALIALLCSGVAADQIANLGVTIDPAKLELSLFALVAGGMELGRTWLKQKFNLRFL